MIKILLILLINFFALLGIENKENTFEKKYIYEYFEEYRTCVKTSSISSISNREFVLIETIPSGYLIVDKKTGKLLEGNMDENSIFYNVEYEKNYYNGYNKYYYKQNSLIYNFQNHSLMNMEELISEAIWLDERITNSYLNYNNNESYRYIQNAAYFAPTLKHPTNEFGTCGQVALAILLGYLDTFYNSYIVPDYIYEDNITYMITKKSNLSYISNLSELDLSIFENYGTMDKLQDILLTYGNYLRYDDSGYPTTSLGLSNVFDNYMMDYIPSTYFYSFRKYCANVFENLEVIKNLIDLNLPVIMTMIEYDYGYSENNINYYGTFHNVVSYGYKNDIFVCHSGWGGNPTDNNYHRVLFNAIWLESYLAIDYIGEHTHSDNFIFYLNNCNGSWCPCGYIHCNHESDNIFSPQDSQYHYTLCDACNTITGSDFHTYVNYNTNLICSRCGYLSDECDHYFIYNSHTSGRHFLKCVLCNEMKSEAHFLISRRGIYYCTKCPYSSSSGIGVLN